MGASSQSGFTLLELMVVIVLLGLVMSFGMLNLDSFIPGSRLDQGAREIGRMQTKLRELSIFHGRTHFLEYDLDQHRYRVVRPSTLEEQKEEGVRELIETSWSELPKRVRFQDLQFGERSQETRGVHRVEFTPTGEVVGHLVHLIAMDIPDEEHGVMTVELNPITGLVSYTRGVKGYAQVASEFEFR